MKVIRFFGKEYYVYTEQEHDRLIDAAVEADVSIDFAISSLKHVMTDLDRHLTNAKNGTVRTLDKL